MVTVTATQWGCPLDRESSHGQDGSEWAWLCFNRIWGIDVEMLISYNFPFYKLLFVLWFFFNHFKMWKLFLAQALHKTGGWLHVTCGLKSADAAGTASYVFVLSIARQKRLSLEFSLNLFLFSPESLCRARLISKCSINTWLKALMLPQSHIPEETKSSSSNMQHVYFLHPF